MSLPPPPVDAPVRARALDVTRSFLVQAPAGSGKTELLVQRYLRLLASVDRPEEVLAITFTRKAAAEMKRRVVEQLPGGLALGSRLRVQTIDALCASLTRQMPILSRFGAQPESVDDASELYLEAAMRALALHPPNSAAERLLFHFDNDVAEAAALIAAMLGRRDQWLRRTGGVLSRVELEAAFAAEGERLLKRACALYPAACQEFAADVLTKKGTWRKRPPAPPALVGNEPLRQALFALHALPPKQYDDRQWTVLHAMLELLPRAAAQLKLVFAERGQADFAEIAQGAVRALGEPDAPTDLLLALDTRIRHILIDEFQDTSLSQWALLERLTAGWENGDGRTLFAVGDPMQSIYRFREADVGLFLRAKQSGIGHLKLESLQLATNFRSQADLVEWVNATLPMVFAQAEDEVSGAVPFAASRAHHAALDAPATSWHLHTCKNDEARRVVSLVQAARAANALGTIAILVRTRSHLESIVPALQAAGIRYRAVEIETLGAKQVVQDLHALTRALSHPGDRVAWLALLRAPWCGLTPPDLAALAEAPGAAADGRLAQAAGRSIAQQTVWMSMNDEVRLAALSGDGRVRVERLREILRPALAQHLRGRLRDRVEGLWLAFAGPACVTNETALADAAIYLDALEQLEVAGELPDDGQFERKLATLYAQPAVDAGSDAVDIMTVHKAKGLEFDTVILPGLDRTPRREDPPMFAWRAMPDGGLLLAPIRAAGATADALHAYVHKLNTEAAETEAGRVFYVGVTRARQRLHLLGCVKHDDEGDVKPPSARALLGKVFAASPRAAWPPPPTVVPVTPREGGGPPDALRRLPSSFVPPGVPAAVAWRGTVDEAPQSDIEFSWAGETARHIGTVTHRWLQRIAQDEMRGWSSARIDALSPSIARELRRRGVPAVECEAAAGIVAQALTQTLGDERGRWLLGPHAEAASEYRVRTWRNGLLATHVMDRVFRTGDGTRWIVDFKTSRHEGGDTMLFLDRERERYAPQLQRYLRAVEGTRAGLYFPLLTGWRTVEVPSVA